jgi:hypothetical protein
MSFSQAIDGTGAGASMPGLWLSFGTFVLGAGDSDGTSTTGTAGSTEGSPDEQATAAASHTSAGHSARRLDGAQSTARTITIQRYFFFCEQRMWHIKSSDAQPQGPPEALGCGLGPDTGTGLGEPPGCGRNGRPVATFGVPEDALAEGDAVVATFGSGSVSVTAGGTVGAGGVVAVLVGATG